MPEDVRERAVRQMERLREMLEDGDITQQEFNRQYCALAFIHFPNEMRAANKRLRSQPKE